MPWGQSIPFYISRLSVSYSYVYQCSDRCFLIFDRWLICSFFCWELSPRGMMICYADLFCLILLRPLVYMPLAYSFMLLHNLCCAKEKNRFVKHVCKMPHDTHIKPTNNQNSYLSLPSYYISIYLLAVCIHTPLNEWEKCSIYIHFDLALGTNINIFIDSSARWDINEA